MPTRNVVLTDHQSEFVDALVASGRYQNASEAMRSGLRLLEREEAAWEEVKRGDTLLGEDVFARIQAKYFAGT
jgi:antitoxin ParD1/3/4